MREQDFLYTVAEIPQLTHSFYGHCFIVKGIAYSKHSYTWYIEIRKNTCNMGDIGGFQLLDLIIKELKSHMTCYTVDSGNSKLGFVTNFVY